MLSGSWCSWTSCSLCVTWLGAEKSISEGKSPYLSYKEKTGSKKVHLDSNSSPSTFAHFKASLASTSAAPQKCRGSPLPVLQHLPRKMGNVSLTHSQSQRDQNLPPPRTVLKACNEFSLFSAITQRQPEGNQLTSKSCSSMVGCSQSILPMQLITQAGQTWLKSTSCCLLTREHSGEHQIEHGCLQVETPVSEQVLYQ